ncbi:MAG: osmotically inducible protein C [Bdellovibrio sp. CG12_big_fil_rev_8_21_14_0_65_39_13]|nr:MAG: osmotically inducible protein C [Bdellovibrio sp. CG22_combo_CG10-13_8_21_14_all_39_27]PIQ62165.1 MAG: osmotically inducible protein C [Bdellovibrio sp. CG12_big_fil_rev_8_21_14_0_65_39_13]PIR34177.1 MAG: osmotically inducible protein C [Bdellovibrio sp. CG11_big_fil_rev_8_21_14_0_20_39_38]
MTYKVESHFIEKGLTSFALGNETLKVDVSKDRDVSLPGPAELLLTALSSCILKNIERFSDMLKFEYSKVHIEMEADRRESPPQFIEIRYKVMMETQEEVHRIELLHKNIKKFGTVYNSLSDEINIVGEIVKVDL